jgi:MFS transporter, AAHS family, 4-hydroxybenzoate transporter
VAQGFSPADTPLRIIRRVDSAAPTSALDVRRFIDERPVGAYQLRVAALCAAVVCVDGFDAQVMGYVAPALSRELHIARVTLGSVISSGTVGMMIGALVLGPIADRAGRKPVLVGSVLFFGLGSLLTATADSIARLTVLRVLTGFGLGGAMPNAIALTSEYMPKRSRNAAVMAMFCGFAFGSALAGWVSAAAIGAFGWQSVFIVGGSIPIVVAIVLVAFLPESIRFLVVSGSGDARARGYLSRIAERALPMEQRLVAADERRRFPVGRLFAGGRRMGTLLLWLLFFMSLLDLWFLNNWLPTILNDGGIAPGAANVIASLFQVGGIVGTIALAAIVGRRLSFAVLAVIYASAAGFIVLIGSSGASVGWLAATISIAGMCVVGAQTASNALAAEFYPTTIRATGIGWALGIGRAGSILGPILGGLLLSYAGDVKRVFWAAAIPPLIAAAAAIAVRPGSRQDADV